MPADPLHELQAAVRRYARHVLPGAEARRVVILDEHKEPIAAVRIPACVEREAESIPVVKVPAIHGWDFTGPTPSFDGTVVPVHGRRVELLPILAAATAPMTAKAIREKWDKHLDEGTVRWWVGELRKSLVELFPGLDDPISNEGDGYFLRLR